MSLPVVFIHNGNSTYLVNAFYQLKKSNPGTPVYLIGTSESKVYNSHVTHVLMKEYMNEADSFKKIYRHFSTNSEAFELICIQRWFILKEFLVKNDIERCLYMDSDVLFYTSIEKLAEKYEHVGMTRCGISGHTNFVRRKTLEKFCRFITDCYIGEASVEKLRQHAVDFVKKHGSGGVSDMTFINNFAVAHPDQVADTYTPESNETIDPSFKDGSEDFVMKDGPKKILFKKNIPFGYNIHDGHEVMFHTLHFQGTRAKNVMAQYIPERKIDLMFLRMKYKLIYICQKIIFKLLPARNR